MIEEKLNFAEWRIRQFRGKIGKVLRKTFPTAPDSRIQDLGKYFAGNFTVEVTCERAVWVEAYEAIHSCMQGLGGLCHQAYVPKGIKIAVLRNSSGEICARMLLNGMLANKAYGPDSYILTAVLGLLSGVEITPRWLEGVEDIAAYREEEPEEFVWVEVPCVYWLGFLDGAQVSQGIGPLPTSEPRSPVRYVAINVPCGHTITRLVRNLIRTKTKVEVLRPYLDVH